VATVHSYVDTASTSGGDGTTSATTGANRAFVSLNAALAALYVAYPNFVTSTVNPVIHCAASGGANDATAPGTYPAFTSSATYYLVVQVDSANRAAGIYNTSKYRLEGSYFVHGSIPSYTRLIGLQQLESADDLNVFFVSCAAHLGCQILYNIARFADKNYTYGTLTHVSPGNDMGTSTAPTIVANNLFYGGVGTHGRSGSSSIGGANAGVNSYLVAYSNTIVGFGAANDTSGVAIVDGYSRIKAVNNLVMGWASFGNPNWTGTDYNASDLATTTYLGTHGRASQTFTFVDAVGTPKNYQLASTDTGAKGYGTDLSSDATFPITDDITGTTRTTPWDIGAFVFQAASGLTLSPATGVYSLTGNAAPLTLGRQLSPATGSYAVTGNAAPLTRGLKLAITTGAYSLVGNVANLLRGLRAPITTGSYSVTGNAAPLTRGYKLTAVTGAYSVTGNAAQVLRALKALPATGVYTITGNPVSLSTSGNLSLAIATGLYNVTGNAAALTVARKLFPATGAISVTGTAAQLARGLKLSPATGSIVLTGNATPLTRGLRLSVTPGVYSLSGNAATTLVTRLLSIVTGVYQVIGNALNFLRPGAAAPLKTTRVYAGPLVRVTRVQAIPLIRATRVYAGPLVRVTRVETFPN